MDAGRGSRVVRTNAAVVVGDDVGSAVAVEVEDDDLVSARESVVDDAAPPGATRFG